MALELKKPPDMDQVRERVAAHFSELFQVDLMPTTLESLEKGVEPVAETEFGR